MQHFEINNQNKHETAPDVLFHILSANTLFTYTICLFHKITVLHFEMTVRFILK